MGVKILNFNKFLGFQKNKYFFGCDDFVDIFGVITKLDYVKGSFLCILESFIKLKVQNGGIFFGLLKFPKFFGML